MPSSWEPQETARNHDTDVNTKRLYRTLGVRIRVATFSALQVWNLMLESSLGVQDIYGRMHNQGLSSLGVT